MLVLDPRVLVNIPAVTTCSQLFGATLSRTCSSAARALLRLRCAIANGGALS